MKGFMLEERKWGKGEGRRKIVPGDRNSRREEGRGRRGKQRRRGQGEGQ